MTGKTVTNVRARAAALSDLGRHRAGDGRDWAQQPDHTEMPPGAETGARMPDLVFLYPGLDVSGQAAATRCGAAHLLNTNDGVAILHLEST
jgi:hypothetical protein